MMTQVDIQTKRVYDSVEEEDRIRILVDGVWPRGLSKEKLKADLWLKDAAPSTTLRKWFNHDRSKWEEFKSRYFAELNAKPEFVNKLHELTMREKVTLLFSARDNQCNQAVALQEYLQSLGKIG